MKTCTVQSYIGLLIIWMIGLLLAIGSKSYDPDEEEPVPPVNVDFTLTGNGIVRVENGNTVDTISNLVVGGTFEKAGNAGITLRQVPVSLDTTTEFTLSVTANEGENLLVGEAEVDISQTLEFGLNRLPSSGQLMLDRDGTTTLITFDGDGNNVVIAVGSETRPALSFSDFRTMFSDRNQDLDERFASKAYRTLETLWEMARVSETVQQTVNSELDMLQSIGFRMALSIDDCANTSDTPAPSQTLTWSTDVAGSGLGVPGEGDSFTADWTNCNISDDERFFDNNLVLNDYTLTNDTTPRQMSYAVTFNSLLIAEETIDSSITTLTRILVDGVLEINSTEGAVVVTESN